MSEPWIVMRIFPRDDKVALSHKFRGENTELIIIWLLESVGDGGVVGHGEVMGRGTMGDEGWGGGWGVDGAEGLEMRDEGVDEDGSGGEVVEHVVGAGQSCQPRESNFRCSAAALLSLLGRSPTKAYPPTLVDWKVSYKYRTLPHPQTPSIANH